jgi:hypothetical protein
MFLLGRRSAHDLNEIAGTDVFGECSAYFIRGHIEITLRGVYGLVERQSDARARDESARDGIFARFG